MGAGEPAMRFPQLSVGIEGTLHSRPGVLLRFRGVEKGNVMAALRCSLIL
jgi:hypothetical protein